ncbi:MULTISPECIES: hypothetical protein [unclassified Peribacillus]
MAATNTVIVKTSLVSEKEPGCKVDDVDFTGGLTEHLKIFI